MLVAMLVLFTVALTFTTVDRLRRTNELLQESLALRGNLLVEYLESATRASLRGSGARAVLLADLAQEISSSAELRSLVIVDEHGNVLVSLNRGEVLPGDSISPLGADEWKALKEGQTFALMKGNSLLFGRSFKPFGPGRVIPPLLNAEPPHPFKFTPNPEPYGSHTPFIFGQNSAHSSQLEQYSPFTEHLKGELDPNTQTWENMAKLCLAVSRGSDKLFVLVELSSKEFHAQSKQDLHSALILAGIIFAGCTILALAFTWLMRYRSREVQNLRRTMAENQHLAAVGRLAASVAHEVRNPLSSLRGLVQLMGKNFLQGSKESNYAQVAVDEVDRLERVVSDLLNYTRPRTPRLLDLDMGESITAVLSFIKDDPRAKGIDIHCELPSELPSVPADPDLIRQVLLNLIINALEAMNGHGNLWIKAVTDTQHMLVQVKDDGPGLPEGVDVFDPFFSGKPQGSGLGLAIAKNIIVAHHGILEGFNSPEGGAVMEIKLRLKQ